jgi:hypothetical protein
MGEIVELILRVESEMYEGGVGRKRGRRGRNENSLERLHCSSRPSSTESIGARSARIGGKQFVCRPGETSAHADGR